MKLKKLLALGLALGMMLSLAACGSNGTSESAETGAAENEAVEETGDAKDVTITFATYVVGTKAEA